MKKAYTKPQIMFEDFSLSTSIALGCEFESENNAVKGTCGYFDEGLQDIVFVDSNTGCTFEAPVDDKNNPHYNGICYDIPDENYNLFTSY